MTTNKSPYEIRLDVLKMARDMLEHDISVKLSNQATVQNALRSNLVATDSQTIASAFTPVDMYTSQQLIEQANQLYSFVATDPRKK